MIILLLFGLLVALVAWVLIAPLQLQIDTSRDHYQIAWKRIGYGKLITRPTEIVVRLKLLFWQKEWPLPALVGGPSKRTERPTKTEQPTRKPQKDRAPRFKVRALLRTFQLKQLRLHLDTDDFVLNSYLFPIFHFLNRENRELKINYRGEAFLQMVVENQLYRIIWALLR